MKLNVTYKIKFHINNKIDMNYPRGQHLWSTALLSTAGKYNHIQYLWKRKIFTCIAPCMAPMAAGGKPFRDVST